MRRIHALLQLPSPAATVAVLLVIIGMPSVSHGGVVLTNAGILTPGTVDPPFEDGRGTAGDHILHFDNTLTLTWTKDMPTDTAKLINVTALLVGTQFDGIRTNTYTQNIHIVYGTDLMPGNNSIPMSMDATKNDVENVFGSTSLFTSFWHLEDINFAVSINGQIQVSPEPTTLTLLGIGIAGMAGYAWRRKKRAATV
jgi:hypothetical protein